MKWMTEQRSLVLFFLIVNLCYYQLHVWITTNIIFYFPFFHEKKIYHVFLLFLFSSLVFEIVFLVDRIFYSIFDLISFLIITNNTKWSNDFFDWIRTIYCLIIYSNERMYTGKRSIMNDKVIRKKNVYCRCSQLIKKIGVICNTFIYNFSSCILKPTQ